MEEDSSLLTGEALGLTEGLAEGLGLALGLALGETLGEGLPLVRLLSEEVPPLPQAQREAANNRVSMRV